MISRTRILIPSLSLAILLAGCAGGPSQAPMTGAITETAASTETSAPRRSLLVPVSLEEFQQLPEVDQQIRREAAARYIAEFHSMQKQMRSQNRYGGNVFRPLYLTIGVAECLGFLGRATNIDPSNAEVWFNQGRFTAMAGDRVLARRFYSEAAAALMARSPEDEMGPMRQQIAIAQGWLCYDLGYWDEGLAWLDELPAARRNPELPTGHEASLCRGLLLAASGQHAKANIAAQKLEAVTYRVFSSGGGGTYASIAGGGYQGLLKRKSKYCSDWIRARAYVARGDYDLALTVLGELYWYRRGMPYSKRFWNDVGLICELAGKDEDAGVAYGIGFISSRDRAYILCDGFGSSARILDKPAPAVPAFTSYNRFYLAGSRFAFATQLAGECLATQDPTRKQQLAADAIDGLDVCLRHNIWPARAWALRGRVLYAMGDFPAADCDLREGHKLLADRDLIDPMTSFLIGMLRMDQQEFGDALPWLFESVGQEITFAGAWRALSVALLQTGDATRGRHAAGRAIEMQPDNVAGHYNRGLLNIQEGRWDEALVDLTHALNLAPTDEDVQKLHASAMAGRQEAELTAAYAHEAVDLQVLAGLSAPAIADPSDADVMTIMTHVAEMLRDAASAQQIPTDFKSIDELSEADYFELLPILESAWTTDPSIENRHDLALVYLRSNQPGKTLALLLPAWGIDLTLREMRIVIEADRALGQYDRAYEQATSLIDGDVVVADPTYWSLVGALLMESNQRKAAYKTFVAVQGFMYDYRNTARTVSSREWNGPGAGTEEASERMMSGPFRDLFLAETFNSSVANHAMRNQLMTNRYRAPTAGRK